MLRRDRLRLLLHRESIVADLEVEYIREELLSTGLVDEHVLTLINNEPTSQDRTRKLLDLLPTRGVEAFDTFLNILKDDYEWLAELLLQDQPGELGVDEGDSDDCDLISRDLDSNNHNKSKSGSSSKNDKKYGNDEAVSNRKSTDQDELMQRLLMKGGVPHQPSHHVVRKELGQLEDELKALPPGHFLALHGMAGSGKSVLASEALRNQQLVLRYFGDGVFWFRVGIVESDKLFQRMKVLLEKLDAAVTAPSNLEHAQEILRKLFLSDRYERSILVLDDVWNAAVVQAFNVGGRVLVTTQDSSVLDSIPNSQKRIITVNSGFTEQESLQLFASIVNVPPSFLPIEASLIHEECKGSPMVISLIGGLIAESGSSNLRRQSGRWDYYLFNLKNRRYSKLKRQRTYQYESVMQAVELSIENLSEELKSKYKDLAVFLDDVAIPSQRKRHRSKSKVEPRRRLRFGGIFEAQVNKKYYSRMAYRGIVTVPIQVLCTYWGMEEQYEVEDMMTEFSKKSLAHSQFDEYLDSYVYVLHDLQLDYLKTCLKSALDWEQSLHRKLLDQYFKKANYDFGQIKDDGYIYSNFAYHLYKSGRYDLFPKLYLDLTFVESMLKACGAVELLNDYKKYDEYIIGEQDDYLEELEDFEAFVRTLGSTLPQTDIVQVALREPEESSVYKKARHLSLQRPETLYLEWLNKSRVRGRHLATFIHHGVVEDALFLVTDITKILTCNGDGQIKLWDVQSGDVLHRFTGHKASIKTLAISNDGEMFASGSEDGTVKLWDLGAFVPSNEEVDDEDQRRRYTGLDVQSEQKEILRRRSLRRGASFRHNLQQNSSNSSSSNSRENMSHFLTAKDELRDLSNQSYIFSEIDLEQVLCVAFSPDAEEIVASGQSGLVKVFNLKAREHRLLLQGHKEPVNVCRFSLDGRLICTGSDDSTVRLWSTSSGEFVCSINRHSLRVLDMAFVANSNKAITMSAEKLIAFDLPNTRRMSLDVLEFSRTRDSMFNCMSVSHNGLLVAAGTVDHMITVWSIATGQVTTTMPGHTEHIYCVAFTHDDQFLLSGAADETVMIWSTEDLCGDDGPEMSGSNKMSAPPALALGPAFDVAFEDNGLTKMAASDDMNCIQILEDGRPVYQSPSDGSRVTCVSMSPLDSNTVAYGCENGSVRLVRAMHGQVTLLGRHHGEVHDIKMASFAVDVVISVGHDHELKLFREGARSIRVKHANPVINVFACHNNPSRMVTLDDKGIIYLVELVENPGILTQCNPSKRVTSLDLGQIFLAFTSVDGMATLMTVDDLNVLRTLGGSEETGYEKGVSKTSRQPARICRLSKDEKIIAVGYDCGSVKIFDTSTGEKLHRTLRVHSSWVNDIRFSADKKLMVTAGDTLAFWNLDLMALNRKTSICSPEQQPTAPSKRRSSLFRSRRRSRIASDSTLSGALASSLSLDSTENLASSPPSLPGLEDLYQMARRGSLAVSKSGKSAKQRELLQIFDIRGSSVTKVVAKDDFKKFVTIDDAGLVYVLEEITS